MMALSKIGLLIPGRPRRRALGAHDLDALVVQPDVVDVSLAFGPAEECTIAETLPASVDCSGTGPPGGTS
jgi:hypothetical protein